MIKLYNIKFPLCHLRTQCFDIFLNPAIFKVHLSCHFKNPFPQKYFLHGTGTEKYAGTAKLETISLLIRQRRLKMQTSKCKLWKQSVKGNNRTLDYKKCQKHQQCMQVVALFKGACYVNKSCKSHFKFQNSNPPS